MSKNSIFFRYFGNAFLEKIREHIKSNYTGQMSLYTTFVMPTGHPTIKYLVYTGSYLSKRSEMLHSYYAAWSALVTIQSFNKSKFYSVINFGGKSFDQSFSEKFFFGVFTSRSS